MIEETKSQRWWQTLPGILTATAGLITAVAGLIIALVQTGVFDRSKNKPPAVQNQPTISSSAPLVDKKPNVSSSVPSVLELESQLKAANIVLSTGSSEDLEKVRGYFTGPKSAYHLLAINCLQIMGNQRLKKTGYLDMIDKWYTSLVGEEHFVSNDGNLNLEKLKEAVVKAHNEYHGNDARSFEQIVETNP